MKLVIHETMQTDNGLGWWEGDSLIQILVPEPRAGYVMVPLLANVQNDNPYSAYQTVHGMLRRTANTPAPDLEYQLSSPFCILWVRKLMPELLVGGEFFVPVDVFPIPRGFHMVVEWAHGDARGVMRTRCVGVEVPASSVDWSKVPPVGGNYRFTER